MMNSIADVASLSTALNEAQSPQDGVEHFIDYLSRLRLPVAVLLTTHTSEALDQITVPSVEQIMTSPGFAVPVDAEAWLNDVPRWKDLAIAHWIGPQHPLPGYAPTDSALLLPLRCEGWEYGLVWVSMDSIAPEIDGNDTLVNSIILLAGLLTGRLHALALAARLGKASARAQDIAALTEVSLLINDTLEPAELAERIYRSVLRVQSPDVYRFAVYDPKRETIHVEIFAGPKAQQNFGHLRDADPLLAYMIRELTPLFWRNSVERSYQMDASRLEEMGIASEDLLPVAYLGIPMVSKDIAIGAMAVESSRPDLMDENDLQLMLTFASSAAVALENADLFKGISRRVRELAALNEISVILARRVQGDDVWEAIYDQFNALFDTSSFAIGLYDRDKQELYYPLISEHGFRTQPLTTELTGLGGAVVHFGQALHFTDLPNEYSRILALAITFNETEPGTEARSWLGVPLRNRQGQSVGLITVYNDLPDVYSDDELSLLTTIAAQMSLALDNAALLESEQERRKVANTLMEVGRFVSSTLDSQEVLERVLEQLGRIVPFDTAAILLPSHQIETALEAEEPFQMSTQATAGAGLTAAALLELKGKTYTFMPGGLVTRVCMAQQPIIINDLLYDERSTGEIPLGTIPSSPDARTWMGVPMLAQNRIVGVIALDKIEPNFYVDRHATIALAFAQQAAIALDNARLHTESEENLRETRQRARRLASMNHVSAMLSATLERDPVLNTVAELLVDLFQVDHCGIVLLESQGEYGTLVNEYPDTGSVGMRVMSNVGGQYRHIMSLPSTVMIDMDIEMVDEATRYTLERVGAKRTIVTPLIARDRMIGSIGLDLRDPDFQFSEGDLETLSTIAGQVAIAINNMQLYDEAVQANRLKSEFLANISHELRTPLNAIIGYTELLLGGTYGELQQRQIDRLERVYGSAKHLLNLINDVLDLSKIEAGQMKLNVEPLDINWILESALTEIRPQADEKMLSLHVEIESDLPAIAGDGQRIRQSLMNVLGNAVKFTKEGSIHVIAATRHVVQGGFRERPKSVSPFTLNLPPGHSVPDGEWLSVSVIDSGIGIASENQQMIFDAFRQVDGSTIREYGGTGLGLAIVSKLVSLHGGLVWAESEVNVGSAFTLLLPVKLVKSTPVNPRKEDGDQPLILVIDDDLSTLELVGDALRDGQYQIITSDDDMEALELARHLVPAVIVIDVRMPGMHGWELLRTLKRSPETANIPIVVLSVVDGQVIGFYLGVTDYLSKPVLRLDLLEAIDRVSTGPIHAPILLIDDTLQDRQLITTMLEAAGYSVAAVESIDDAHLWLANNLPSLVILDLFMPQLGGFTLLHEIHENPQMKALPVIAITSHNFAVEFASGAAAHALSRIITVDEDAPRGAILADQVQTALKHTGNT